MLVRKVVYAVSGGIEKAHSRSKVVNPGRNKPMVAMMQEGNDNIGISPGTIRLNFYRLRSGFHRIAERRRECGLNVFLKITIRVRDTGRILTVIRSLFVVRESV